MTLAIAKRDTADRLLSKALADNQMRDREVQLIMTEFSQYNVLKDAVRAKLTGQRSKKMFEVRWRQNFEKNNCSRRRIELTYQNSF